MEHKNYNAIHKSVRKKDSMQLLLGKPVYTDDITGPALVVKLLRSPHANAIVEEIHTEIAKKIPGVVDIYTWEDVPKTRFAIAGQTYPEPSPYDLIHTPWSDAPTGRFRVLFLIPSCYAPFWRKMY